MPSANLGMRVRTKTRVEVGAEVGINVGIETGVRVETEEKTGRAEKGPQQKKENPSCMINLTSGWLQEAWPMASPLLFKPARSTRRMRRPD